MGNIFDKSIESISPSQLYNIQNDLTSHFVIFDLRSVDDFNTAHIDLALNSSNPIEMKNIVLESYYTQSILYFSGDDFQYDIIIKEYAKLITKQNKLNHSILLLRDGYSSYSSMFPYMCSNSCFYMEGRLFPSNIEENVFLSNFGVASSKDILHILGITHVLNCTVDCPFADEVVESGNNYVSQHSTENDMLTIEKYFKTSSANISVQIEKLRIPIVDEKDQQLLVYFDNAINFIEGALLHNHQAIPANEHHRPHKVLIHCKHGQSRSATIAAAWLIKCKEYSADNALKYLKTCRPKVRPNEGFVRQLEIFANEL